MEDKINEIHNSLNDDNSNGSSLSTQVPLSLLPTVLHRLRLSPEQARPELSFDHSKASLQSDNWEVRTAAVRELGRLDTPASVALIASALDDPDASVRAAAVHTLGNVEKQSSLYWLISALHDSDWHVRETAVLALGKQGQRVPREVFMTAHHDTDGSVREAATLVLQSLATEERSSVSYGQLWEKKIMQGERKDTISLNGSESPAAYETIPYDIRDGIMAEGWSAEGLLNVTNQVQVYAPNVYGDVIHSHGEKITPSSHRWPKSAWWAIFATAILFFMLGGATTGLVVPRRLGFTQPVPQAVRAIPSQNFRYTKIVLIDIANALHLDPQQITTQLQAGKSMTDIAAGQGISPSELQNIELKAFADAYNQAAKAGDISQQQANEGIQQLQNNPQLLDKLTTSLFYAGPVPPLPLPAGPGGN
jgi:HEAT repeats